ncbi:hypothetical protein Taro_009850 [Colocasia esculenta]|uniref:Uncharacterized protein n=1 Tax=Colocasia esculenta TaxID=4460 RepID=A0A843U7S2_COLES|nr:hypothetical protein [Colocasia esculenta]
MNALQGRGGARFVGGGSWIVGARRWRVASLREGPLRLDPHLKTAGFARVVDFGRSRGKRWDDDVVVCGALLAETGTPVVCDSYGAVQLTTAPPPPPDARPAAAGKTHLENRGMSFTTEAQ